MAIPRSVSTCRLGQRPDSPMELFRAVALAFVWLLVFALSVLFLPFALAILASSIGAALARAGWQAAAPGMASGFVVPGLLGLLLAPVLATVVTSLLNKAMSQTESAPRVRDRAA